MNLYEYVGSNPANLTDPMGLSASGTAPGTTEYTKDDTIWDMGRAFDLIVVTDPKMDDDMRLKLLDVARKRAEELGPGTKADDILVFVATSAALEDAVRRRYEQLNPAGTKESRQLNISVIGHSDKRVGPYVGPGGMSVPIEEKRKGQLLPWWQDPGRMWRDSERAKKVAEDFPKSPISAIKGMVKQITFSSCATAAGQHEKGLLDEVATQLGARIRAPIPPGWTRVLGLRIVFEPQVSPPYKPYHEYIYDTATRGPLRPGE
ncbi:MAG: hypothetical protein NTX87_02625 [Planctomycetota bacterium]|nr:hypothetical protein [Planctomycetota bacterium]